MIRILTLDAFDPVDLAVLSKTLYAAFGVGTQVLGERKLPASAEVSGGRYDAEKLLRDVAAPRVIADDKLLFLTGAPLVLRPGPLGDPPCWGFSEQGGQRTVVSTSRLPDRGGTEASVEAFQKRLGREAIHFLGHLWELHHCYDGRCAMHPSWSPNLPASPEQDLCTFCREKSERKIRLAKT